VDNFSFTTKPLRGLQRFSGLTHRVSHFAFRAHRTSISNKQKAILSLSFTIDDLPHFLVLLVISAVLGWFTDLIAGGRVPLGFFGAILFGLFGGWVATELVRPRIPITLPNEPSLDGVMLITAGIGTFVFAMFWCALSSRVARNFR
jgi:uncharacterized membrane protein YeaQ/YmgE (transglycosylase-associated protein family)